jgi:hypothetical protein
MKGERKNALLKAPAADLDERDVHSVDRRTAHDAGYEHRVATLLAGSLMGLRPAARGRTAAHGKWGQTAIFA